MTINGQSGAGMLLAAPDPRMSFAAMRIVRVSAWLRFELGDPRRSAAWERELFDVEQLLRVYAADYIALACEDLDAQAWASKEAAAGRKAACATASAARRAGRVAAPEGVRCL
jgi:hypothetical protein